ncbi:hypothetical protein HYR99_33655 [Candidatus Poribacteria bacterium]|nr:hypothetical protein [Candidatus Poribacteria bacterium]
MQDSGVVQSQLRKSYLSITRNMYWAFSRADWDKVQEWRKIMKKTVCLLLIGLLVSALATVSGDEAQDTSLKNPNAQNAPGTAGTVIWSFEVINPDRTAQPGEWVQWQYRVTNSKDSTDVLTLAYLLTYLPPGLARPVSRRGYSWDNIDFPPAPLKPGESFEGDHVAWHVALTAKSGNILEADLGAGANPPANPPELLDHAKITIP